MKKRFQLTVIVTIVTGSTDSTYKIPCIKEKDFYHCNYLIFNRKHKISIFVNRFLHIPFFILPIIHKKCISLHYKTLNVIAMTDQSNTPCPLSFKGIPYSDIINRWFSLAGGEPVEGERNDKLHRLASHLRYITDNNEETLLQIMPRYGLPEKEMKGLIHSACSAKWYSVPKLMQEACRGVSHTPECTNEGTNEDVCADVSGRMQYAPTVPPMPKRLPKLIRLLVSRTPEVYRPAVAHAVFPSLATHLHQVRFKYIDNVEHEATLMNVLMAGTGAGKDCISEPINRIMADIRRRDEVNLRREREWKEEVNSKGANKDKRQRPEGLIIQEIDADMTNPAFVMRTAEAEGHFLYTERDRPVRCPERVGAGTPTVPNHVPCVRPRKPLRTDTRQRTGRDGKGHHPFQLERFDHRPEGEEILRTGTDRRTYLAHQLLHHSRTRNRGGHAGVWQV